MQQPNINFTKRDTIKAWLLIVTSLLLPVVLVISNFIFVLAVQLSGDDDGITFASEIGTAIIFTINLVILPLLGIISTIISALGLVKKNLNLLKISFILIISMIALFVLPNFIATIFGQLIPR
jgi:hypothetical protein